MTLRRGQSFQSDQKSNNLGSQKEVNQSSGIEIKMIHYGDNAELKEILNRFHDQEDIKNNEKYVKYLFFYIYSNLYVIFFLYKFSL